MTEFCMALLRRTGVVMAVAAASVLVGGCAVSPQARQSLGVYVSASDQVLLSAGQVVDDYERQLKAQAARRQPAAAARPADDYPGVFDPASVLLEPPLTADELAIARTRRGLRVIHEYNALLLALAERRSEADMQQQAGSFGAALTQLTALGGLAIPGGGLLTGLLTKVATLAQDARNREQMLKLVDEGRAPVSQLLKDLRIQTRGIYAVSVSETAARQDDLLKAIQRAAAPLADLCRLHAPPTEGAVIATLAMLQGQAAEAAARTGTGSAVKTPFPYVMGKPPADAAAAAQANVFVQTLRIHAQRHGELVAAQKQFHTVLGRYVLALEAMEAAFGTLSASLNAPVDLRAEVRRLLGVGFELRDAVNAYRNPGAALAPQ